MDSRLEKSSIPCWSAALLWVLGAAAPSLLAQDVIRIDGDPSCSRCTITALQVAVLGDEQDGIVGPNFVIARDDQGRYLVAIPQNPSRIQVFDSTGTHLATVGRRGQGPGEYSRVSRLAIIDGRIHVFDSPARRRTVLDSTFAVLRTSPIPGQPLSLAAFPRDTLVVNTSIRTQDLLGFTLHVLAPDGRVVRSMGFSEGVRFDFRTSDFRQIAGASDREFWAAHTTEYILEKWNLAGQRLGVIQVEADWLPGYVGNCCTVDPDEPPEPALRSLRVDERGRLWVLGTVHDAQWHEAVVERAGGAYWVDDWDRFFDSIVDVIDPGSGELIARQRFDEYFTKWAGPGLVASNMLVEGVYPRIRVTRLRLVAPDD